MHAFSAAAVGFDDLEIDLLDRRVEGGERVLEVQVLLPEGVEEGIQPDLVEVTDPGGDGLFLVALDELGGVTHRCRREQCGARAALRMPWCYSPTLRAGTAASRSGRGSQLRKTAGQRCRS
ncbi:hypothetical protein ACFPRL_36330 [Pseudoclavibacter helvolus]